MERTQFLNRDLNWIKNKSTFRNKRSHNVLMPASYFQFFLGINCSLMSSYIKIIRGYWTSDLSYGRTLIWVAERIKTIELPRVYGLAEYGCEEEVIGFTTWSTFYKNGMVNFGTEWKKQARSKAKTWLERREGSKITTLFGKTNQSGFWGTDLHRQLFSEQFLLENVFFGIQLFMEEFIFLVTEND